MVSIRMMGDFSITADGKEPVYLASKTRKGVALMEYLILNYGKTVPKQRLLHILWSDDTHANPENAMKTLISRLRKHLNELQDDLGDCIVSQRGSYYWRNIPGMRIDLLEIMRIFEELPREKDEKSRCSRYRQLMRLYSGDLFLTGDISEGEGYQAALHSSFLNSVYEYIEILIRKQEYIQIIDVCEKAGKVAPYDERLHMEMIQAQMKAGRTDEAIKSYQVVPDVDTEHPALHSRDETWDSYRRVLENNQSLQFNLNTVIATLQEEGTKQGAYVCDFEEFCRIYRLLMPTLGRLGCTMFLGLISLDPQGGAQIQDYRKTDRDAAMASLVEILRKNLRHGDIVTSDSSSVAMVLLPAVNYTTGNMIMERIRYQFFEKNPDTSVPFRYRLGEIRES